MLVKIIFGILMIVGIIGTILPVLPGSPLVFGALLLAKIFGFSQLSWWLVFIFGILTIVGMVLDYLLPFAVTKRIGGSKYGLTGLGIGLIVGIIFSPFGLFSIIIAPFLGVLAGELIYDRKSHGRALKAASASVAAYFMTTIYGLILSFTIFAFYLFSDIL